MPGGPSPYYIKGDYQITDSMTPLAKFELLFTDDAVRTVYAFKVEGSGPLPAMVIAGAGGVFLRPVRARVLTTPSSFGQKKGEEVEVDDPCEHYGVTQLEASDLDEDDPAVDTDAESLDESGTSSGSASESSTGSEAALQKAPPKNVPATGGTVPATGGTARATRGKRGKAGKSGPTLYDNGYFFLKGHEFDLKMYIHDRWLADPPVGLGRTPQMTKTITPSTVGETREDLVRSLLLLKAWMLSRARVVPGWIESTGARQRLFAEEADAVLAGVKRLQPQADGVLGNAVASNMMQVFVPDLVGRI